MAHYEERLEADLSEIRTRVIRAASHVEEALRNAERTLRAGDRELASATILGDHRINRETREIDALCHSFVARHLPSAGHLRFVSAVMRVSIELERIGDYAATVCREAVQLSAPPPTSIANDIELMAEQGRTMLAQSIQAFHDGNAELARGTAGMARQARALTQRLWSDLEREGERESRPVSDLFAILLILNRLERVSDQAKNICEETIFAATGETKAPKAYSILFVDETNAGLSQIAEATARKSFPESGRYASAGWAPAAQIDADVQAFLADNSLDYDGAAPRGLGDLGRTVSDFDIIVGVGCDPRPHLDEVPFHSTVVTWSLAVDSVGAPTLNEALKSLSLETRSLMETLHGPGAG
ncbi:MAG: phosphate signaling complex protein PhoU [Acidobacteriota bacterium]|nr:phosphate signaling complex protein PhoU [Acidobacteriota bacterium]